MELYIGGLAQGKLNYVLNQKTEKQNLVICDGASASLAELFEADLINHFHLFIQRSLAANEEVDSLPHLLLLYNPYVTIICDEVGRGVVPLERADRIYREKVGRICQELAKRSQKVVRIQCGIGLTLKETPHTILCSFIRHGKTTGNLSHRYIGCTDEPLCEIGIQELTDQKLAHHYPSTEYLYISPMQRCLQTANLLYPKLTPIAHNDLRECDFGLFENKNYKELSDTPDYQKWIDSNGTLPFPNGEAPKDFTNRCVQGFLNCMSQLNFSEASLPSKWVTFVVHGGTIMSLLSSLTEPKGDYFSYQVGNGEGYLCAYDIAAQTLNVLDVIHPSQKNT